MTRGILSLFLITTLLVVRATPESNIIYRRQATAPLCSKGNGDLYCIPAANDTYTYSADNNATIKFAWNTQDVVIKTKGQVDVYLYRNNDFALVYSDMAVDNNMQILPIKMDLSWFPSAPGPQPKTVDFFFKVGASGSSPFDAPQGPVFHIIEPAAEPSAAATVPAPASSTDVSPSTTTVVSSNDDSTTFTPPLIAIVCVAIITALVAIIALVMAARSRKARPNKSMSTLSTSSATPMVSKYKDSRDLESPVDVASISSVTPLSKKESQPNIAQRISLSSPSRSSLTGIPSLTFSSVSSTEEEKRLRREAKELMKKELAEEGTGLQSVSRKQARIETMDAKDLLARGELESDDK
ncbi:262_t:CDS:2 [Paraglomus occultum]|uniref:262_t:CDS:1 n=1 Tax=Paraglomus occultum TaxID=144539 RepID=A0A9N8ZVS5_9GLOM|nr:262_t:CDS:2 [Paraglomus occultum]